MKKMQLVYGVIVNLAIFSILTPGVFADDSRDLNQNSGVAMIALGMGEFTCSNGNQLDNVGIFVLLSETTRKGLSASPSGMGLKSVENNQNIVVKLNKGQVESNNFHVEGILIVDEICDVGSSVVFTANGACGVDSNIVVRGSDGSSGNFQSSVICN